MSLGESLTNLVFACTSGLRDVKYSGNWMYAAKLPGDGAHMFDACDALCDAMDDAGRGDRRRQGLAVDGGARGRRGRQGARLGGHVRVRHRAGHHQDGDPGSEASGRRSSSSWSSRRERGGGGSAAPRSRRRTTRWATSRRTWTTARTSRRRGRATQDSRRERKISAGHDVQRRRRRRRAVGDGVSAHPTRRRRRRCRAGPGRRRDCRPRRALRGGARDLPRGAPDDAGPRREGVRRRGGDRAARRRRDGATGCAVASRGGEAVVAWRASRDLRDAWEATELRARAPADAPRRRSRRSRRALRDARRRRVAPHVPPGADPRRDARKPADAKVKVAILREEGSNGDREMAAAIYSAGHGAVGRHDVGPPRRRSVKLEDFRGSSSWAASPTPTCSTRAKGWAGCIKLQRRAVEPVPGVLRPRGHLLAGRVQRLPAHGAARVRPRGGRARGDVGREQPRFIHNDSRQVRDRAGSPSAVTPHPRGDARRHAGLEDRRLDRARGGQGQVPGRLARGASCREGCAPHRYVDADGEATRRTPQPQRLAAGIAGLCSKDGRHLAMMPHPERAFLGWQMPWCAGRRGDRRGGAGAVVEDVPKRPDVGGEEQGEVKREARTSPSVVDRLLFCLGYD